MGYLAYCPLLIQKHTLVFGIGTTIPNDFSNINLGVAAKVNHHLSHNVDIGMILLVGLAYKVSERIKFYSEYKHSTSSYDLFLLRSVNTNFNLAFDTADNNFMAGFKYIFKGWK